MSFGRSVMFNFFVSLGCHNNMKLAHLFESIDWNFDSNEEMAKFILKECAPYLSQLRPKAGEYLYRRSMRENHNTILTTHSDRIPRDNPRELNALINEGLKQLGLKANRSNSFFCSRYPEDAYGKFKNVVFPIGHFDFTWSRQVHDLYETFYQGEDDPNDIGYNSMFKSLINGDNPEVKQKIAKYFQESGLPELKNFTVQNLTHYHFKQVFEKILCHELPMSKIIDMNRFKQLGYTDQDIQDAVRVGNEVMIHCERYVQIPTRVFTNEQDGPSLKELIEQGVAE